MSKNESTAIATIVPSTESGSVQVFRSENPLVRAYQDTLADAMSAVGTMLADGGDSAQRAAAKKWYTLATGLVLRARMVGWTQEQLRIALLSHLPDIRTA